MHSLEGAAVAFCLEVTFIHEREPLAFHVDLTMHSLEGATVAFCVEVTLHSLEGATVAFCLEVKLHSHSGILCVSNFAFTRGSHWHFTLK